MRINFIKEPVKSLAMITDNELRSGKESMYLKILNDVGSSENLFWSPNSFKIISVNHFKGIRAILSRSEDILHYKEKESPSSNLTCDLKANQNIDDYSYEELIHIAGQESGVTIDNAILPASIITSSCNPLMDCSNCHGTGLCPECNNKGLVDCTVCDGSGKCTSCDGNGECPDCHGSKTCSNCEGDGQVTCSNCDGDGSFECEDCDGSGKVDCTRCDGSGGCQVCYGSGQYQLKSGRYVTCKACNGSGKCSTCNGRGDFYCGSCSEGGEFTCNACDGDGTEECHDCHGYGKCRDCHGTGKCRDCHGVGKCFNCHGAGKVKCPTCGGSHICSNCKGETVVKCVRCNGTGKYQTYISYGIMHNQSPDKHFFCILPTIEKFENEDKVKGEFELWNTNYYTINKGKVIDKKEEMLDCVSYTVGDVFRSFVNGCTLAHNSKFHAECSIRIEQIPATQISYQIENSYHSLYIIGTNHFLYFDSWPSFSKRLKHKIMDFFNDAT